MGQGYGRDRVDSVGKMDIPQLVFPSGASGATLTQTDDVTINGAIKQITVGVNDNDNDVTVDVSIVDADGAVLFTAETTAEDTDDALVVQQYMTVSGTDLPLSIFCAGVITVSALISGNPGASTGLCDVSLYVE